MPLIYIAIALFLLLALLWKIEPRSLFNAGIFGLALVFGYLGLLEISFYRLTTDWLYMILILIPFVGGPLLYLIGSLALIWNGRTMVRREGVSLSHLLAPVVGAIPFLLVAAGLIVGLMSAVDDDRATAWLMIPLMLISGTYLYFLGNAYVTIAYGWLYTAMPKTKSPDFIIIHGAGLIDGKVGPLLASRCDRGIDVFNAGGQRAILIPSGGQGDDEPRAEGWAMAEYLIEQGVPADKVVPEDQSRTTDENMRFSKLIIDKIFSGKPRVIFVTSNYHVFRTALIARRVGLKAQGVGSRTAGYYLPSAIIREIIAIIVMYKWWHIVPLGFLAALFALGFALA